MSQAKRNGRGGTRTPGALWWLAFGNAALAAAAYAFFVRSELGQRLDDAAFLGRDAVQRGIGDAEGLLGGIELSVLAGVLAVIGIVAFWRGRTDLSTVVLLTVVGANLTTQVLKHVVLDRPHLIPDAFRLANSYPGGHVTAVASLSVAAALVVPVGMRAVLALLGAGIGFAVGAATVLAGWHRPSDVIGAWFVVGMWAALATAIVVSIGGTRAPGPRGRAVVALERSMWVAGGIAAAVALVAAGGWIGLHWGDAADPAVASARHGLAMTAGVAGMAAAAILVPESMVAATRRLSLARA